MMNGVLVIGAGITGAGIARDLAYRGIPVTVVERYSPARGATGRCHGLLHSGARYAVKDPRAASECARENLTLKNIAPEYIESTGGLFIATDGSEAAYGDVLRDACRSASVGVEKISPKECPNEHAIDCFFTNDAAVDPFLLTLANLYDAQKNGAVILTGTGIKAIEDGRAILDDDRKLKADVIVNATGHECRAITNGRSLNVQPDKGTILVTERRACDMVLNRMRPPSDGDIIVPSHTTSLIGTTSAHSASTMPERDEYRKLMREAAVVLASIKKTRIIRAYSGVRALIGSGDGRSLTRDHYIEADGGVITVAGGKLTTYRLIAEKTADAVMKLFGEKGECRTKSLLPNIIKREPEGDMPCNCERAASRLIEMDFLKPADAWKFNRIGFGACQGMRCARNAAMGEEFLEERWKGIKPVLDDIQMKQSYLSWASCASQGPFS